jgi:hypothetical protein
MNTTKTNMLKQVISQVAGIAVDFTIRGEKSFTFHFEGKNERAMNKIANYFLSANVQVTSEYDLEIDYTCIFIEA